MGFNSSQVGSQLPDKPQLICPACSFNSSQVGSQLFFNRLLYYETFVSIPHRQARNNSCLGLSFEELQGFNSSQVGSQQGKPFLSPAPFQEVSIPHRQARNCINCFILVDRMSVSIPHRQARNAFAIIPSSESEKGFNSSQVGSQQIYACHTASFFLLFQFLIGRLATKSLNHPESIPQPVSIPHRQARNLIKFPEAKNYLFVSIPHRQARNTVSL